jgi:hypothetical protein
LVFDVKLEAFREKHRRATDWRAVPFGETLGWPPEEEDAARSPFRLARHPKSALVAANKK